MLNLSNEIKMDIYANRNGIYKEPLRSMEKRLNIDHVTIMRKSIEIEAEIKSHLDKQVDLKIKTVSTVISLAMMGQMASRPIAAVLKRNFGTSIEHDSVLNILNLAGQTAHSIQNSIITLENARTASFDEIFQNQHPLLVFINNQSSVCILKKSLDRKAESWSAFLEQLIGMQLDPESIIGDGGPGLGSAIVKANWFSRFIIDIFHCLKKLSEACKKMESICYYLLHELYSKENKNIDCSSSDYKILESKTEIAIELYDKFESLLKKIQKHARLGDPSESRYIPAHKLKNEFLETSSLLERFTEKVSTHKKIKAAKTYIINYQNQLVLYKEKIESAIQKYCPEKYENILNLILPIIEYYDQYRRSYENASAQQYWADQILESKKDALEYFKEEEFNLLLNEVSTIVSQFSRSNSNIENLNNQIRRYFEVYKSIPEWFPSLFSFYWNFRIFERGKRKGFAPVELLLNGKLKKDWLDLILENFPYEKVRI